MTEELTTRQSTYEEATERLSRIRGSVENQKRLILEAWEHNDAKTLGCKTWEEYADKELGQSRPHFYRLLEIARGQRIIENLSLIRDKFSCEQNIAPGAADTVYLELMRLKDDDKIISAWKEAAAAAPHVAQRGSDSRFNGKITASLMKSIVDSRLKPAPDRKPAVQSPKPSAPATDVPVAVSHQPAASAFDRAVETNTPAPPTPKSPPTKRETFKDDEDCPETVNVNAFACQRDDERRSICAMGHLGDGTEVIMWIKYAILPRECQPR